MMNKDELGRSINCINKYLRDLGNTIREYNRLIEHCDKDCSNISDMISLLLQDYCNLDSVVISKKENQLRIYCIELDDNCYDLLQKLNFDWIIEPSTSKLLVIVIFL